jgi:hypothetical protein
MGEGETGRVGEGANAKARRRQGSPRVMVVVVIAHRVLLCKTGGVMRFGEHFCAADFYKQGNCRGIWVKIVLELGWEGVGFLVNGAQRAGGSPTADCEGVSPLLHHPSARFTFRF